MTAQDSPSTLDFEALEEIQGASGNRVKTLRTRAEKWIPAFATISGLVTAVLIVKGPDTVTKLNVWPWRLFIALAFLGALIAFAYATYSVYSAAFGGAETEDFDPDSIVGLHARLLRRRIADERSAKSSLRKGIIAAYVGVGALAVGVGLSWFAPPKSESSDTICVAGADGANVELAGDSLDVIALEGELAIGDCT